MKTFILATGLVAFVAASSFGQGTITFRTGQSANPVMTSMDGTTATFLPTTGVDGLYGTVSYALLTAPSTTPLFHSSPLFGAPSGWTVTLLGPVTYSQPGAITSFTVTLPASAGAPGANVDLAIVAFTGTFGQFTQFASSGDPFPYSSATTTGAYSWLQPTGNPNATPAGQPAAILTGTAGFGSLILNVDGPGSPEPSTIAIGGLGAALLLYFRRRK